MTDRDIHEYSLSDRDILVAIFELLAALAEQLTEQQPIVNVSRGGSDLPSQIYGTPYAIRFCQNRDPSSDRARHLSVDYRRASLLNGLDDEQASPHIGQ
jgi:hypothetical protein